MKKKKSSVKTSKKAKDAPNDLIQLILADHQELKKLIAVMKDVDEDLDRRFDALNEFRPTLLAHAEPEELVLYRFLKKNSDSRVEGFEGQIEHIVAEQLLEETYRRMGRSQLSAMMKVLAETVEKHIQEEETAVLPHFKKTSDAELRSEMGKAFLRLKPQMQNGQEKVQDRLMAEAR